MKRYFCLLICLLFFSLTIYAQRRAVRGTILDSTKTAIAGATVRLTSAQKDTLSVSTDAQGNFQFPPVIKASQVTLTISALGYQGLIRHYKLNDTARIVSAGNIILKTESHTLNQVNIVDVNPIKFKEDTIEYNASAYKVRDNAPIEDAIRKMPGVDVDQNGNITAQGKAVTKVRVNGKDFFNGDVQSATRNIPADIVENVQFIDDYGDQANLTGVKTGDPTKIMNITIKPSKSHGYTGQATLGDGSDVLPAQPGVHNDNRYLGLLNEFNFNGDEQTALLANVNNTNVNTFSFGSPANPPSGGDAIEAKKIALDKLQVGGLKISGNGGGGNFSSQSSGVNGITDTHTAGFNYRDQWGKNLSVYGSYSLSDNTNSTTTNTLQQNTTLTDPGTSSQLSNETDKNINHRVQWNMEYKPDASNYLKVTPTFSYSGTNGDQSAETSLHRNNVLSSSYSSVTNSTLSSPNYGFTALFDHRFKTPGRNFSISVSMNFANTNAFQNPVYNFMTGPATAPADQYIYTKGYSNNYAATLSYLEPIGQYAYLEFNYSFNQSVTNSTRETDALDTLTHVFARDSTLSNEYNYTFTTNRFGLNYRYGQKGKYNYTLGFAVQPAVLNGFSPMTGNLTHASSFNIFPVAHLSYNFGQNETFGINYSGHSNEPSFLQLQPVIDFSNVTYPVEGNPDLKPSFTNNFSVQFNKFSFETGRTLFTNFTFSQTQNQVTTNTIIYPALYAPDPQLSNTYFTKYLNADGYYTASGFVSYGNSWDNRKYSLNFNGAASYTNNVGYITNVDPATYAETTEKNTAKTLAITSGLRFRVDLPEIIDAQFLTNYSINKTDNSVKNGFTNASADIRQWGTGISGKNYFHDWTVSYDYSKVINYGYAQSVHATNPNLLNMYVERRFMKGHRATIRLAVFDLFNQNTGFSTNTTASTITQTNTNRLGRYYLASFTLRLQKFGGGAK